MRMLFVVIAVICVFAPALAAPEAKTGRQPVLTVYNQGTARIEQAVPFSLPKGQSAVSLPDVAETIQPASLTVRSLTAPDKCALIEANYVYDPLTPAALLNAYVGKSVKVVLPDPKDSQARVVKEAKILSNVERPVFETDQGVYLGNYEGIYFPEKPAALRERPALSLVLDNSGPAEQDLEIGYLCDGFSWKADYSLMLASAGGRGMLTCLASLTNNTTKAFASAKLRMVAGDPRRITPAHRNVAYAAKAAAPAAIGAGGEPQEEAQFEYHVYSLDRPVDLAAKSGKQIALFSLPEIVLEKELISRFADFYAAERLTGPVKQPVSVVVKLKNEAKSGLGRALPRGVVRVYSRDDSGSSLFLGEDTVAATPIGGEIKITCGTAFDYQVERRLTDYKKTGKNTTVSSWEVTIKGGKAEPGKVVLEDRFPGVFTLTRSSKPYVRSDARTVRFELEVPPAGKGTASLTYEVQIEN